MALVRLMIDKEIEHAKELTDVFRKDKSRVFHVFQSTVMKRMHYAEILHPLLDTEVPETLLAVVEKLTNDLDVRFVFSMADNPRGRDQAEREAEILTARENFRIFMLEGHSFSAKKKSNQADGDGKTDDQRAGFQTAVQRVKLPSMLQQIFSHALVQINARQFSLPKGAMVPDELVVLDPLLYLFVEAILVPVFRKLEFYAGPRTRLTKSAEKAKPKGAINNNMVKLADFLDKMMDGSFDDDKAMAGIVRQLKPKMLKLMKTYAEGEDSLETNLLVDVFQSHFQLEEQSVSIRVSDLLQLSNMLHTHTNKLRLTQSDEMEKLSRKIGQWNDTVLQKVRARDTYQNFTMRERFLLSEKCDGLTFCRVSKCPVPPYLTAGGSDDKDEVLRRYVPPTAPWVDLEMLFAKLPPLASSDFVSLRAEFLEQQSAAKEKTPPDFGLADNITRGMNAIDALLQEESLPKAVLKLMSNSLSERDSHRRLLAEADVGLGEVEKVQSAHYEVVLHAERCTEDLLKFAMKPQLNALLLELGAVAFPEVIKKMKPLQKVDPTKLVSAGCTFSPTAKYPLKKLQRDGVCTQIQIAPDMQKKVEITMQTTTDGGVKVVVSLAGKQARSLRRFQIPQDAVSELKRAAAGTEVTFDNSFITFSSPNLHKLLDKLSKG